MVSGASVKLVLEFQFQISYACWWWPWAEAYWFSAMSLSKWPPGGHIGFFGFRTLTLLWLWISTSNFRGTILMYMGRSLLIFSKVIFKWSPGGHIRFFGFWTLKVTRFPGYKSSLLWNFNFKLHVHVNGGHRQKPIDFQRGLFQNVRLVAILDFFVSRL